MLTLLVAGRGSRRIIDLIQALNYHEDFPGREVAQAHLGKLYTWMGLMACWPNAQWNAGKVTVGNGRVWSTYIPHDNIHEINTWKCPIQTQYRFRLYISVYFIITPPWYDPGCCWSVKPRQTKPNPYDNNLNIHEINTWKCPIQTQCG